jgi:glycosyltransferase involved in cell wall biosynthesis
MARALPRRWRDTAEVVHHGCDLDLVDEARLDTGLAGGPLRIVALGTVNEHKRFDVVVHAVAELADQGQPAELEIWGSIGDERCADVLRAIGRERLGHDPLRGPATRRHVQEILTAADVLTMGSSTESFGLPLLEGMRTSCLIWVPQSELVRELCGSVAVTYPEGRPIDAARALIASLPEAHRLLPAGRARSLSFTWESTVERTLRAVSELK